MTNYIKWLMHPCCQDTTDKSVELIAAATPTIPQRPTWLPTKGPGNLNVIPEEWGMSLRQWCAFIMGCKLCKEIWTKLEESRDQKNIVIDSTTGNEHSYVNLYQICDTFVKPWTRNLGNSIALLLNGDRPLKAEVMISHAWGEDIIESVVSVVGKMTAIGMTLDTTVWFCTFAQYQPGDEEGDCGPGVATQLALDPFKKVISSKPRFGMLVIHTSAAELYGRLWCVYEVNASEESGLPIQCAASFGYFAKLDLEYRKARHEMSEADGKQMLIGVKAEEAKCFLPDDEKRIKGMIEKGIGYEALNGKIMKFRDDTMTEMFKGIRPLLRWAKDNGMSHNQSLAKLQVIVRSSAYFVALHCLTKIAAEKVDNTYIEAIVSTVREESIPYMACKDFGQPLGVDEGMRKPDGFLDELMQDDELCKSCLLDLTDFQHPIAWLQACRFS